jgi:chromosome segregation ATPase
LNRLSREYDKRVLEMHFNGVPRDTIAHELKISAGKVSETKSLLPSSLEPLRQLSIELRRNNLILPDALQAVSIRNDLVSLGVKPSQFSAALRTVIQMSNCAEHKPQEFLQAGIKLAELENQSGKTYPESLREFEQLNANNKRIKEQDELLKEQNRQLRAQIAKNKKQLAKTYEAANAAPQEIREFREQTAKLAQNGVKISDVVTLLKLLKNVEELEGDPKKVVSAIRKTSSLKSNLADLKKQAITQNREFENMRNEKETLEPQIQILRDQKTALENNLRLRLNSAGATLASLDYQIGQTSSYLQNLHTECFKLENLKKSLIAQTGEILGLSSQAISCLQVEADFDVLYKRLEAQIESVTSKLKARTKAYG